MSLTVSSPTHHTRRAFLRTGFAAGSLAVVSATTGMRGPLGSSQPAFADVTPPLVPARMAEDLCGSYLINTKLFYATKVYKHTDAVIDLLKELGARGIREHVTVGKSIGTRNQQYAMPVLAAAGCRWHGTVGNVTDWQNATSVNKQAVDFLASYYAPRMGGDLSALMHSFGGCNEVDNVTNNGPDWAAHARIMQAALWKQAKANSATWNVPVAGPSTRTDFTPARAAALGDLSAISEMGNGHLYNKGRSPSGEIDEHLSILNPVFPNATRWIMTETGYNNSPQDNKGKTVPESASATYVVRGICDFFKRNTAYCRFELLDDPDVIDYTSQSSINRTAERQAHFGLVAMTTSTIATSTPDTWRKKPEFYATKNLLGLMSDRGGSFTPAALNVSVTGGGSDLQQLLLQKRDGRHYLLLWRDVQVCTNYPDASPVAVTPVSLSLQMTAARTCAVYQPTLSSTPIATYPATTSMSLALSGDLKIIEIG